MSIGVWCMYGLHLTSLMHLTPLTGAHLTVRPASKQTRAAIRRFLALPEDERIVILTKARLDVYLEDKNPTHIRMAIQDLLELQSIVGIETPTTPTSVNTCGSEGPGVSRK